MARRPRRTLQTRLALLYGGLFLVSGVVLLAVTILLLSRAGSVTHAVAAGDGPPNGRVIAERQHSTDVRLLLAFSVIALPLLLVASIALGWLVAGRVLRPLRTITATAREISATNLHARLGLGGPDDEVTELGQTLDDLFERLEASFVSQRNFVANASHELRTPLTAERTLLQVALADPEATAQTLRSTCEELLSLGAQQERLIEALLTLASSEQGVERWEPFDLADVAGRVVSVRQSEAERREVQVKTALADARAAGDPSLVESLVANLVDNAVRHNMAGGRVEVATSQTSGRATLSVTNSGPVLAPEEVAELFEPFRRVGHQRTRHHDGHGLGLTIVGTIARAHGAALTATPRAEGGLHVEVSFPASA